MKRSTQGRCSSSSASKLASAVLPASSSASEVSIDIRRIRPIPDAVGLQKDAARQIRVVASAGALACRLDTRVETCGINHVCVARKNMKAEVIEFCPEVYR